MTLLALLTCRYEGPADRPVDRDGRHDEGCHPAGGEAGGYSCRSGKVTAKQPRCSVAPRVNVMFFLAGVAAVAIENSEGGKWIKEHYKASHCIPEELQGQLDKRNLDFFKGPNN